MHRLPAVTGALLLLFLPAIPADGWAQGLPAFAPLNPVASSRTGLYFQPYRGPSPGGWAATLALDYASVIELNETSAADYVLDSEILRLGLGLSRDLGSGAFLELGASAGGIYPGFLDGFLDWYHDGLGIRVGERERRPRDNFLYRITLPDGRTVSRKRSGLFLRDVRAGLGVRLTPRLQTLVSVTLPTSSGPEGYGRGVPSIGLLNTLRVSLKSDLVYEGSLGLGLTPKHGALRDLQRTTMAALSSGLRYRFVGSHSLYANVFYHSSYYSNTSFPALDRRELSLDFGWLVEPRGGGEWRLGITEDLEPGGPGVDLVLRVGRTF
ncbi:MAG: DUF3187 family protein [Gemmatimonadales bacterium]